MIFAMFNFVDLINKKNLKIQNPTVILAYINTVKTTFDLNFDLNQAVEQHGYINIEVKRSS